MPQIHAKKLCNSTNTKLWVVTSDGPCPLWPNGWMDQDGSWHRGGPWSRPHCGRWGPSSPPQKGADPSPIFGHFCCGQMAGCIKMPFGMEVGLSPGDLFLDGDPAPSPKRGRIPIFGPCLLWPNGWMHQDVTWYAGSPQPRPPCLRWGPSLPPQKGGGSPPIFGPCLLWPNGCMDQDASWYVGVPRPRRHRVRWGPSSPSQKGAEPPHQFSAHVY